ncbi:hypothetical protein BCR44DRAFT_1442928 [Catenaria anguillulae PL171]|uniref:Uncharacterized protein n=1 Tax=Catenaria anguillulae PL171 TaxID=765915 RepID=A0A1Y2H9J4_9FUNG|nr:hypothetical protein BCR44DRAFT_1442928 [Catenaria anguillulae PL171]
MVSSTSSLPVELWAAIVAHVTAPLTQFVSSPAAARRACLQDTFDARDTLISLAHVNKATYAAARPYLYGTLSIGLRNPPVMVLPCDFAVAADINAKYVVHREQLAIAAQVFPGCPAHLDRDARIAQVSELYLASLVSKEKQANELDADALATVVGQSVSSLLLDGRAHDGAMEVKVVNGLVLVSYPMHLLSSLYIRTGPINPSRWLNNGNEAARRPFPYFDWKLKLPFLFDIAPQQLRSLTLSTSSTDKYAFKELCDQLFEALPQTHQDAYVFQMGRPGRDGKLPQALSYCPLRRLEVYGKHPWDGWEWARLFNHPSLETLVTDFLIEGWSSSDIIPWPAPRLKTWITNQAVLRDMFQLGSSNAHKYHDGGEDNEGMLKALEDFTIVTLYTGEEGYLGYPDDNAQVPALPYKHIGKHTLRRFAMAPKYADKYLWINICSEVLFDLLSLPLLESLHLPTVLPFFKGSFEPHVTCANLSTLEINLELFLSLLANVSFPCLTSLTLVGDYMIDENEDRPVFSPNVWLQIASSPLGPQLRLESIHLFTSLGHVDVTHLPQIAPNLRSAKLDIDHLEGLPSFLAHPGLTSLTMASIRCPTVLEQLLAHDFARGFALNFTTREAVRAKASKSSTIDDPDCPSVCARKDMALVFDRRRNANVWRKLATQPLDAMIRGQVDSVLLVVPADAQEQECTWIVRAAKKVMLDWEGVKVKLGVTVDGDVDGLKKIGYGKIVGQVDWLGKVAGWPVGQKDCFDATS